MTRKARYLPVVRARRWLLLVLAIVVVAVAASWYFGRREVDPDAGGAGGEEQPRPKGLVLAGEGFDYELTEGERKVFRIQADRILSDRRENITLERVKLVITREDGSVYEVFGDRGDYRLGTSEARIAGHARVRGRDGLELRARDFDLIEDGKVLVTAGRVEFGLAGAYRGEARRIHYDLEAEVLQLTGDVKIESSEGGSLASKLLVYERGPRILRLEGDVEIVGGGGRLSARRLTIHLDEEEKQATFVRARWNVAGELTRPGGGDLESQVSFEGNELSVLLAEGEPTSAELDPVLGRQVRLTAADTSGIVRRVVAPQLTADFIAGVIQIVRGYDGVEVSESLAVGRGGWPLRSACGRFLLAGFDPAGEIEDLVLQNDVDYQEPGLQLVGDRVERRAEQSVVTGRPAVVRTDRGEVSAPRIVLSEGDGRLQASDGVRAELPRGGKFRLIGESPDEPIRITARSARWTDEPWQAEFRESVRAWQGENYLVANRVVGLENGDRLEAEGAVKTVVRPREEAPAAADAERRAPVEVTADRMVYLRPARLVTYSGRPRALQAGRTVTCDELDIVLGERDRFDSLLCRGGARLENPERGQTVEGEDAVYRPDSGVAEVSGAPVVLRDRDGGEVRGKIVVYDFDEGTAQVRSAASAPAPAAPPAASGEPPPP